MAENPPVPAEQAAQLQEAMDTIAQAFDYPSSLQIRYTTTDGSKRTMFEFGSMSGSVELVYDGRDDQAEPELTRSD